MIYLTTLDGTFVRMPNPKVMYDKGTTRVVMNELGNVFEVIETRKEIEELRLNEGGIANGTN